MTIKEQHFQGGWSDKYTLAVDEYTPEHGLVMKPVILELNDGLTATAEDMKRARRAARETQSRHPRNNVVITVLDSDVLPENDRNAPLLASTGEKKITGDSGDIYYTWKPR